MNPGNPQAPTFQKSVTVYSFLQFYKVINRVKGTLKVELACNVLNDRKVASLFQGYAANFYEPQSSHLIKCS